MAFEFRLAKTEDDHQLKSMMKNIKMSGNIALSFEREPSYFMAEKSGNLKTDTMLVVDKENEKVVGIASRSLRYAFVDGVKSKIGYLSNLRGDKKVRNSLLLAKGYKFLKNLHQNDKEVDFYISTILSDNTIAQKILTSQRAGLPIYESIGEFTTGFIPLNTSESETKVANITRLKPSVPYSIDDVVEFINNYNSQFQFAPFYTKDDFIGQNKLEGFSTDDFYLYIDNGEILGLIGAWNQTNYKQVKVASYSKLYQIIKPLYNLYAKVMRLPPLPPSGSYIKNIYGSFVAIKDDNRAVFESLVKAIQVDWSNRDYSYLAIGLHSRHPLSKTLLKRSSQTLKSMGYLVYWKDKSRELKLPTKQKIPHIETGTL